MSDIVTECSGGVRRIQFNRLAEKNAMTPTMYITIADLLNNAAKDDSVRVVLLHGAGDSFCAGNDLEDFLKKPMGPGGSWRTSSTPCDSAPPMRRRRSRRSWRSTNRALIGKANR